MNVILYKNASDPREMPKKITDAITKTGSIKDATSIMNPVILVNDFDTTYNYCYIEEFHRYFYIVSTSVVRTGVYEITLKCDVLESFYDAIVNAPVTISRSTNKFNSYIPDGDRKFYQYTTSQIVQLGTLGENDLGPLTTPILVVVG